MKILVKTAQSQVCGYSRVVESLFLELHAAVEFLKT